MQHGRYKSTAHEEHAKYLMGLHIESKGVDKGMKKLVENHILKKQPRLLIGTKELFNLMRTMKFMKHKDYDLE